MLYISRKETDPYFNIAAEEYFLKNFDEEIFMLWQNEPSVIIGKHQNTLAEINLGYIMKNNIPVIRRISGGGTVYHDTGNLNYTFIRKGKDNELVNFRKYTQPVIDALVSLGINANFEGKNDIRVEGLKISGNAEHVYKNRVLHHGTLLFSSHLSNLSEALQSYPARFHDRSVQSVRSKVRNIREIVNQTLNLDEFTENIKILVLQQFNSVALYELSSTDVENIQELADTRYRSWQWNYAYSPGYYFRKTSSLKGSSLEVILQVDKGLMRKVRIITSLPGSRNIKELEKLLTGVAHYPDQIMEKLSNVDLFRFFTNINTDEFIECLF